MSTNSYVQVREENGKWWFTKDKECFISMGINHVDPNLMLASYNKKNSLKNMVLTSVMKVVEPVTFIH